MVNKFKLTVVHVTHPSPMQICACGWSYRWTKNWKIKTGPWAVAGRGQPGLRAAGPLGRGGPPGFSDGITFTKLTHRFEYLSSNSLQDGHRLNRCGKERDTFL